MAGPDGLTAEYLQQAGSLLYADMVEEYSECVEVEGHSIL